MSWNKSENDLAQGYVVSRSTSANGPFAKIAAWNNRTRPEFTDHLVGNGTNYFYVIAAVNQAGTSASSKTAQARPVAAGALPADWMNTGIGKNSPAGGAKFADAGENTFIIKGAGGNLGGKSDALNFTYRAVTGDFTFTARLLNANWPGRDKVGLMARESLASEAEAAAIILGDLGNPPMPVRSARGDVIRDGLERRQRLYHHAGLVQASAIRRCAGRLPIRGRHELVQSWGLP